MIRSVIKQRTSIAVNEAREGETIEQMMRRIIHNREPIEANSGIQRVFHERNQGIPAETNIRTDAWELAVEGTDIAAGTHISQREKRHKKTEGGEGEQNTDTSQG